MYPELFTIKIWETVFVVHAYSFFYMLAIVVVIGGTFILGRKKGFAKKELLIFLGSVTVGGFFGARLLHFATNLKSYFSREYDFFSLNMEGFAVSGGIISALLAGFFVCRKMKIDFWKLGDVSVVFLGVGIAFARIGCFLNGCCFGKVTTLPWGVRFPNLSQAHQHQLTHGFGSFFEASPVHPTQIYEALAVLAGSFLALYLMHRKTNAGVAILSFGIWFAFFRLVNLQLRVMPSTFDAPEYFYPIFYIAVMLICIYLLRIRLKKNN